MIRLFKKAVSRFRKDESGGVVLVEFVILTPLLFISFMMSIELGFYSIRNMFLERSLEQSVRFVRLNTSADITHASLKQMVCDRAGYVNDCDTTLRLEMKPINPRLMSQSYLDAAVDCIDTSQPIQPERGFTMGEQHELMIIRACVKFNPVFPAMGLGYAMSKDGSGQAAMFAMSAFVQEPS